VFEEEGQTLEQREKFMILAIIGSRIGRRCLRSQHTMQPGPFADEFGLAGFISGGSVGFLFNSSTGSAGFHSAVKLLLLVITNQYR
jgi:hypothetical protein